MKKLLLLVLISLVLSCFPYIYYKQEEVLIKNVNIDQTLDIAINELNEGGFDSILTIWAIRDQIITPEQAKRINEIYLEYIDKVVYENETTEEFGKWHFAWAISNIYRNGNDLVKKEINEAYVNAKKIPSTLTKFNKIADEQINGEKIYMGDVHGLGRAYAKTHIVVPGNSEYVQSYKEYLEKKSKNNNKII
jgi:hypothetical protein